ncbi:MAG: hypothetical protein Q6J68_01100 [Thermostichales cyanobacterium SZTDM-1c_bins_54]
MSWLSLLLAGFLSLWVWAVPIWAKTDPYVSTYLQARDPIDLPWTATATVTLTPEQLSQGKQLFERHCLNCHVGGTTLPNPAASLSLGDLRRAQLDTLAALTSFQRDPGDECRRVSPRWLSDQELLVLEGFVLQAARVAPGWGTETFSSAGMG